MSVNQNREQSKTVDSTILTQYLNDSLSVLSDSKLVSIATHAFYYRSALIHVTLENVVSIASHAFGWCSNLETFSVGSSLSYIDGNALASCINLREINLLGSLSIPNLLFEDNPSIQSVYLPNCTGIGNSAFQGCTNLISFYAPKVSYIGSRAFLSCTSISEFHFPNLSRLIYDSCFHSCSNLTTFEMSGGGRIANNAFEGCINLTSFYLTGSSPNVTYVSSIDCLHGTPLYSNSGTIYVAQSLYSKYLSHSIWGNFSTIISSM